MLPLNEAIYHARVKNNHPHCPEHSNAFFSFTAFFLASSSWPHFKTQALGRPIWLRLLSVSPVDEVDDDDIETWYPIPFPHWQSYIKGTTIEIKQDKSSFSPGTYISSKATKWFHPPRQSTHSCRPGNKYVVANLSQIHSAKISFSSRAPQHHRLVCQSL